MAISGSLSDVAVADILTFIHLGRRSGTLVLQQQDSEVCFSFCDGKMVAARAPGVPNLGELLLRAARISPEVMHRLAAEQLRLPRRIPYGCLLLREGVVDREGLRELLQRQFEIAVAEARGWDRGSFEFLIEDPRVDDDIAIVWGPGDVGISPEVVLLEAARIFDECNTRRRADAGNAVEPLAQEPSGSLSRLRRTYSDLRSGLLSENASLILMHMISESFERAILFLVKVDALVALGAFGNDSSSRPLAAATRGLRLDVGQVHLLTDSLRAGELRQATFDEAGIPEPLLSILGQPRNSEAVAFPVVGAERVIGVIYADGGDHSSPPNDIEILSLAAGQVGLLLENQLLLRQVRRG